MSASSSDGITLRACAKVNLFLEILGRRANGYHDLRSIVAPVSLADDLYLEPADSITVAVNVCADYVGGPCELPGDERNLACRAARALKILTGYPGGVAIRLGKRIPVGGGMGGGSADAAAVLRGCNTLWNTQVPLSELMRLGATLGCDVPALVHGGAVLMEGLGERIAPLTLASPSDGDQAWWLVIANPGFHVGTRDIYQRLPLPLTSPPEPVTSMISALENGDRCAFSRGLFNGLEATVVRKYPLVGMLASALRRAGALAAMVSGSGASVFGLATGEKQAGELAEAVTKELDGSVWCRVVRILPDGVMVAHGPLEA